MWFVARIIEDPVHEDLSKTLSCQTTNPVSSALSRMRVIHYLEENGSERLNPRETKFSMALSVVPNSELTRT